MYQNTKIIYFPEAIAWILFLAAVIQSASGSDEDDENDSSSEESSEEEEESSDENDGQGDDSGLRGVDPARTGFVDPARTK